MKRSTSVVAGLLLGFVGTSESFAETTTVCPSGCDYTSIQDAINDSSDGDVINIHAGMYNEHSLNPEGRSITIQGTLNGDGSLATTIDAQQGGSVFWLPNGTSSELVIKDLVITGGQFAGNGGGIYCVSSPSITGCTISGNTTGTLGGGIFCGSNSSPSITDCTISGNTATQYGGGIACLGGSPTITGCTISGNSAVYAGNGIYCQSSSPIITDCTFEVGDTIVLDSTSILNPTTGACPADLNNDGKVDGRDLAILLNAWGPCPMP